MKNAIVGISVVVFLFFTSIIIFSIQYASNINDQVTSALDSAIATTQQELCDGRLDADSNEDYINRFNENIQPLLDDNEKISYIVNVYGIDYRKGLLDLGLKAEYRNLIGENRSVTVRKSMIIDIEG